MSDHRLRDDRLTSPTRLAAVPDTQLDDDEPRDRKGPALLVALVVAVLVGVGGVLMLVLGGNDVTDQRDAAVGQSVNLAQQVQQACTSGQLPATDRLCTQAAQVQAEPIPGSPGVAGAAGVDGAAGRNGLDGRDGADGAPGTQGVPGVAGKDGAPGVAGQAGQDGAPGQDGAAGQPGRDGATGKPPASFTFPDQLGRIQRCTRDGGSPDDAATYTCAPVDGDPSEPAAMRLFFPT